jgi:MFS family permease
VSLVISLACGFYLLSGNYFNIHPSYLTSFFSSYFNLAPVASALCNKWGCRPIGIIGSIIAALAVAASILSPNIYIMWLLFGFIGGIGMGLVYLPSIVMVGYYFEEKRAIATGKILFFLLFFLLIMRSILC